MHCTAVFLTHGQFLQLHGQFPQPHGQFPQPHGQFPQPHGQFLQPRGQFPELTVDCGNCHSQFFSCTVFFERHQWWRVQAPVKSMSNTGHVKTRAALGPRRQCKDKWPGAKAVAGHSCHVTSCHASGMAVEAMLDIAYPVLASKQARRTMPRYMSEHNDGSVMPGQRGALKELDYGPPARRIGDVSAGAQNTYVEAAYRIASPARGMSSGPPAAPCRSAECKEHPCWTAHRAARW